MVCGRVRVGTGAAQHILVTMGLGHSHAARASLVSVLKGGGVGKVPTTEAEAEQSVSSSTSPKGPLEAGREDSKPQRQQHEGQPGRKIRLP